MRVIEHEAGIVRVVVAKRKVDVGPMRREPPFFRVSDTNEGVAGIEAWYSKQL